MDDVSWLKVADGAKEHVPDTDGENAAMVFWCDNAIDAAHKTSSLRREETELLCADDVCNSIIFALSM